MQLPLDTRLELVDSYSEWDRNTKIPNVLWTKNPPCAGADWKSLTWNIELGLSLIPYSVKAYQGPSLNGYAI